MAAKIVVTLCALVFGLVVPVLEVNATHVFNPAWPGHARLHEVWQLVTNSALAAGVLWLVWAKGSVRPAALIGLAVVGGFLIAWALSGAYGGTMVHPDGSELLIAGVNPAVGVMVLAALGLAWVAAFAGRGTAA